MSPTPENRQVNLKGGYRREDRVRSSIILVVHATLEFVFLLAFLIAIVLLRVLWGGSVDCFMNCAAFELKSSVSLRYVATTCFSQVRQIKCVDEVAAKTATLPNNTHRWAGGEP